MRRRDGRFLTVSETRTLLRGGGGGGYRRPLPWAVAWSRGQTRSSVHSVGLGATLGATGSDPAPSFMQSLRTPLTPPPPLHQAKPCLGLLLPRGLASARKSPAMVWSCARVHDCVTFAAPLLKPARFQSLACDVPRLTVADVPHTAPHPQPTPKGV